MDDDGEAKSPLFPLFLVPVTREEAVAGIDTPPDWLSSKSFTTNLSLINETVSSLQEDETRASTTPCSDQNDDLHEHRQNLVDAQESEKEDKYLPSENRGKNRRNHRKKKRPREIRGDDFFSRKSTVRAWVDSGVQPVKDYYFDTVGDQENVAYGCPYRMDVPRYKLYKGAGPHGFVFQMQYHTSQRGSLLDDDGDNDGLDLKLKYTGRYWHGKFLASERSRNLKRLRFLAPKLPANAVSDEFVPLFDAQTSQGASDHDPSFRRSVVEESWEDEVMQKTRDFNRLTTEHPYNENIWVEFAEFQDKIASRYPQKGVRLQMLEKKISILEKAAGLNPGSEELLLHLLRAYQGIGSTDVLISRWKRALVDHSGSCKLWKEYLLVVQAEFSRFRVSEMRKLYANAIQAISALRNKQLRQTSQNGNALHMDSDIVQLEKGLVDIYFTLCRFEWQAGYQELATALLQAEIEFSLFCPSLRLSEQSKLRLFEHFWSSDCPKVGEDGALGWSIWLVNEEESRWHHEEEEDSCDDDKGGWTGWSEPPAKPKEDGMKPEGVAEDYVPAEEFQKELESEGMKNEGTVELLKELGIDTDVDAKSVVEDVSTWIRWVEEESSRDHNQWLPVHSKSDMVSQTAGMLDTNADECFFGVILFEDLREFLFPLSSQEARFSLISQFIEFFGGNMLDWICTNNSSWADNFLSLEVLPDSMIMDLRSISDALNGTQNHSPTLDHLLSCTSGSSKNVLVMKFLRNAIVLCFAAFPRNHKLEKAALVTEELSVTTTDSSTPCRALAKFLLKSDRQDMLLCGVYAQREAIFGNINQARKIFDMALSSIEGLPYDLQCNAPMLYIWYAESERSGSVGGDTDEACARVLHILWCLGSGVKYRPFEHRPSSVQLLRAHQGFKESLRAMRSSWSRGAVDDQSLALVCSAALFEELTAGCQMGAQVLDDALTMMLPDTRSQNHHLELLQSYYVNMLLRHKQSNLAKAWELCLHGLSLYPYSFVLYKLLMEIGHLYATPNKLRLILDDLCSKKPSVIVWLFALSFELARGGSEHRIHSLFEKALATDDKLRNSVLLWRLYLCYEADITCNMAAAKRVFFRAVHSCPRSKKLWLDGFLKLKAIVTPRELSDLHEMMMDKELNLRTDIYEILLLQDQPQD